MQPKPRTSFVSATLAAVVITALIGTCTTSTPPQPSKSEDPTAQTPTAPPSAPAPVPGDPSDNGEPEVVAQAPPASPTPPAPSFGDPANFPVFTVDVSEYPSWIAFTYAQTLGLLEPAQGKVGSVEIEWGVDIVLQSIDYDPCIARLAGNNVDATTITNIDALAVSEGRTLVAIFPTSTSDRADAIIAFKEIPTPAALKDVTVWGLEKTVSHYVFDRVLEKAGLDPATFTYKMKDPQAAATEMQQKNPDVRAISVWNPFKIQVLTERGDEVHVLGDSGVIPLEVLDLMVVGQDVLDRTGGDRFAAALAETFYAICTRMNDPATRADTLLGMIDKFAPLTLAQMETCVTETRFFDTADKGLELYRNPALTDVMATVKKWTDSKGITSGKLKIGYGTKEQEPGATFRYDSTYMELAKKGPHS